MLVAPLPAGPLDVIGDVHGELDALAALLAQLGYDEHGAHADGRRLVFVGDLCDRGPDSPGVLRLVQRLVAEGRAHATLGNHELNLLRNERKHGNHWFFGQAFDPAHPEFGTCVPVQPHERAGLLAFMRSLPLVLEREDLRVVHAAWDDAVIARCRDFDGSVESAYEHFEHATDAHPEFARLRERATDALERLGPALHDRDALAIVAPASAVVGDFDCFRQMANPVRVATSGVERSTTQPFFAGGKWRFVDRAAWWRDYAGAVPVLFGHYWRWWNPARHAELSKGEPHLFADDPIGPSMNDDARAFCIDFSAGSRFRQRHRGDPEPFHGRLAAMRWPERELMFDAAEPDARLLGDSSSIT
jgi:hypothetical protein